MSKSTDIIKAAARTAVDPTASREDAEAANRIVDALELRVGDEVIVETATIYWAGIIARMTTDWIILVDATSVVQTGETSEAIARFVWQTDERIPGDGVVRVAMQGVMAILRRGGS